MAMIAKPPSSASMNIEGAVYEAALVLDADERREFLNRVFVGDAEGLARMEGLLEIAGESAAYFLQASQHRSALADAILDEESAENVPEEVLPPGEEAGTWIGPYRIVSRIGEGGCGVVYEADQEEPVKRRVALKILRPGMDTERVIARFGAERQALAMMDHPNIARVLDAGATGNGRPYFVMERVAGERITTFCDREKFDIFSRINLFIQICHAIQHAHQKGVIHRDIKPSNVLVARLDGAPAPKVIDFGIAKATGEVEDSPESPRTARDQFMGTPPYMSPEQIDMGGTDIDTRSDVYSLGALLYELLGGRPPFDARVLANAGVSGMRRMILEVEPPLLSRMLADLPVDRLREVAAARCEDPQRLVSRLHGDLEWIVATAMAKDRNGRYQTVNALAAELRRFLAHEPVLARPPRRLYLMRKFVRRNRTVCALGLAVAVSLVAGLGTSTWLYLRERDALGEQARLSREAEAARAVESQLRAQAQARANVSQAAVLLTEGRIQEADALLGMSPLESIEPSREAAGVFRVLGNWNAFYGRWKHAVQCYRLLHQANRLDEPATIVEGCEILAIASALLEDGDQAAYDDFRREMLDLYLPAENSLQAEHLLQACLLTPADEALLQRLENVANVCEAGHQAATGDHPDWEAFAMALYYHRLGDPKEALTWSEKSLSLPGSNSVSARAVATLCLGAIARHRMDEDGIARQDLARAQALLEEGMRTGLGVEPAEPGTWYTWIIARRLLREAEEELNAAAAALERGATTPLFPDA